MRKINGPLSKEEAEEYQSLADKFEGQSSIQNEGSAGQDLEAESYKRFKELADRIDEHGFE